MSLNFILGCTIPLMHFKLISFTVSAIVYQHGILFWALLLPWKCRPAGWRKLIKNICEPKVEKRGCAMVNSCEPGDEAHRALGLTF
jgi:hypothetical protein